jgi:hypothetical protein
LLKLWNKQKDFIHDAYQTGCIGAYLFTFSYPRSSFLFGKDFGWASWRSDDKPNREYTPLYKFVFAKLHNAKTVCTTISLITNGGSITIAEYGRRHFSCFNNNPGISLGNWGKLYSMWDVGFEVLTAMVMKSNIVWDITSCSPLKFNRSFGGTYRLHLHGRRISRARNQRESRWQTSVDFWRTTRCYIPEDNILLVGYPIYQAETGAVYPVVFIMSQAYLWQRNIENSSLERRITKIQHKEYLHKDMNSPRVKQSNGIWNNIRITLHVLSGNLGGGGWRRDKALFSYSGHIVFESRTEHKLFYLKFLYVFLGTSR